MYYVAADKDAVERLKGYRFFWMPVAVMEIPECRPNTKYMVDCCFHERFKPEKLSRFFLITRLPERVDITSVPGLGAPHLKQARCSLQEFISDIGMALDRITTRIEDKEAARPSDMWKESLIRLFLPLRPAIEAFRRRGKVFGDILMNRVLNDILKLLCLDTEPLPRIEWIPAYILTGISTREKKIISIVGRNHVRQPAYEKYVFRNPDVLDEILNNAIEV